MNSTINRCKNIIRYFSHAISINTYYFVRSVKYSMLYRGKEYLSNRLLVMEHSVEKGITMPNRHFGFGYGVVRLLIASCREYIEKYGKDSSQLQIAIDGLEEYLDIHKKANYTLPEDIKESIISLLEYKAMDSVTCKQVSMDKFFEYTDFYSFAHSRHTCRWFSEQDIPNELISKVIELANTAPSACNRQSVRVTCVSDNKKDECLSLQNGNRGFGDRINKLLVVSFQQPSWEYDIQSAGYLDAGIYTMNILYALHYYHLCACTLNAHLTRDNLRKLRTIIHLPPCEVPAVFIGIGMPEETMMIAKSERLNVHDILRFV